MGIFTTKSNKTYVLSLKLSEVDGGKSEVLSKQELELDSKNIQHIEEANTMLGSVLSATNNMLYHLDNPSK